MTTGPEFLKDLDAAGLTQAGFARLIERLAGHSLGNVTVNRWVKERRQVNPLAVVVLKLFVMLPAGARARLVK